MSEQKKKRVVSLKRLEKTRNDKELNMSDFIDDLSNHLSETPTKFENVGELFTSWYDNNKVLKTANIKDDPRRAIIAEIAESLPYGGKVKRVSLARNSEDKYIVTVELASGTNSKMWFEFVDPGMVQWGIGGSPAILAQKEIESAPQSSMEPSQPEQNNELQENDEVIDPIHPDGATTNSSINGEDDDFNF